MPIEIERKFLVTGTGWQAGADAGRHIVQGYIAVVPHASVRIRILDDAEARVTIKGAGKLSRQEFEYPVPLADGHDMLAICGDHRLEKRRFRLPAGDLTWEIDVFSGRHQGLVLAEIELTHEDQHFERPDWLGEEVTHDSGYANQQLALPGASFQNA